MAFEKTQTVIDGKAFTDAPKKTDRIELGRVLLWKNQDPNSTADYTGYMYLESRKIRLVLFNTETTTA